MSHEHGSGEEEGNAADELRRRRERGKLSQRAFRMRQAAATQDMREENVRMKAAIQELVEAVRQGDMLGMHNALLRAAESAGVDAADIAAEEPPAAKPAASSTPAVPPAAHTDQGACEIANLPPMTLPIPAACVFKDFIPGQGRIKKSGATPITPPSSSESCETMQARYPPSQRTDPGRVSPRLDYGLLSTSTRFLRIEDPPPDILPYIGIHSDSIGAQIFWRCTEVAVSVLRRIDRYQFTSPATHPMLTRMLEHSKSLQNANYILAMAEARLEFRAKGYISGDSAAAEPESGEEMARRVQSDYAARGEDTGQWIGPKEVEDVMRNILSEDKMKSLEQATKGSSESSARKAWDGFIMKLAYTFLCFGDGPRWERDHILKQLFELAGAL